MKITPKAAEAFITKPEEYRAVLLYGPDSGLARERAQRIKTAVLGANPDPMAFVEIEESALLADPARLADEILAINMMAPKRMILLRNVGDKVTGIIREASEHLHKDAYLVVLAEELTTRSTLRSWFEGEAHCVALACYQDEVRDVQEIIRKTMSAAGIDLSRSVSDYLAQQLGNDRYVTRQELEKIVLFAGDSKQLSLEDAQSLVDYNRETGLDDIVNAVADKNLPNLDKVVQSQLREGTQPIAYLRSLMRYFNRLYFIRSQMAAGKDMESVISGLKPKVFYKQEQSLRRHVMQWELQQTAKALALLVSAELACKTSDVPVVPASTRRLLQVTQVR